MKIRLLEPYIDTHTKKNFVKDQEVSVIDKENSDFYHIWDGNSLTLIPKKICKKEGE